MQNIEILYLFMTGHCCAVKCRKEQSVAHGTVSDSGIHGKRMLDITAVLRARRLTWLGHILRLPQPNCCDRYS
jgi:hypothetical protein